MTDMRTLDSYGMKWMGTVPDNWSIFPTKRHFDIQLGKMLQNTPEANDDCAVPYLKAVNVLWGRVNTEDAPEMWANPDEIMSYEVRDGDLLVCEGGEVGRAGIVRNPPDRCIIQNALHRVRARNSSSVSFLMYVLHSVDSSGWFDVLCNKATIAHFTGEKFAELRVPLPSPKRQRAIATFLDRETSRIDELIAKKQRQIELLQEKRSALISHVVTKGLDPNVKMKDSGVEWLGEIPEHWEAVRFKFVLSEPLQYGANESAEYDEPSWPRYVRITDINENGNLREETFKSLPEDVAQPYLLRDGDLLLARSGATVGKTFLYMKSWGSAAYAGYLIRSRFQQKCMFPAFSAYFCRSSNYWDWLKSSFIQATIQNVSAERYANMVVPMPPIDDQKAIVTFLDTETAHIDTLIEKVEKSIELLREYRTALVSAAVTGKIDVREEVPAS